MAEKYRAVVIGTSWWADGYHLPALKVRDDVVLEALCGRNRARLTEVAERHGISWTFTDYERMLLDVKPDVVLVLTPNYRHYPMTVASFESGAHVICEKPLAMSAEEAANMLALAERLDRRHMTFYTYRGLGGAGLIKRLVEEGYLGELHHVSVSYLHGSWLDPNSPASWKTDREKAGSGVLGDLSSHAIDLLQWWFGPLVRVIASLQTFIPQRPSASELMLPVTTDDSAALLGEFPNGAQTLIQVSRVAAERHNYMRIEMYGREGALVLDYEEELAYLGRVSGARAGEGELHPLPIPDELVKELGGSDKFPALHARMTDGFFRGEEGYPTFKDGLKVQYVLDAAIQSSATGCWEAINLEG